MKQDDNCKDKIKRFISKLIDLGFGVHEASQKPQIYIINSKLVNLRCRSKEREMSEGSKILEDRAYWYSISFNVLQEVDWVIYLMTTSDYFIMLPSSFLNDIKERMYCDYSKKDVGIFDINWDGLLIELKDGVVDISHYYHNLLDESNYPKFI